MTLPTLSFVDRSIALSFPQLSPLSACDFFLSSFFLSLWLLEIQLSGEIVWKFVLAQGQFDFSCPSIIGIRWVKGLLLAPCVLWRSITLLLLLRIIIMMPGICGQPVSAELMGMRYR